MVADAERSKAELDNRSQVVVPREIVESSRKRRRLLKGPLPEADATAPAHTVDIHEASPNASASRPALLAVADMGVAQHPVSYMGSGGDEDTAHNLDPFQCRGQW